MLRRCTILPWAHKGAIIKRDLEAARQYSLDGDCIVYASGTLAKHRPTGDTTNPDLSSHGVGEVLFQYDSSPILPLYHDTNADNIPALNLERTTPSLRTVIYAVIFILRIKTLWVLLALMRRRQRRVRRSLETVDDSSSANAWEENIFRRSPLHPHFPQNDMLV